MAQHVETTTSIEQIGQNLDGNFAVRTPLHSEGGWVQTTNGTHQLAAFTLAAIAQATGKKLEITYGEYSTAGLPGYKNVTGMRIV
jgi:hypothetical protein